MSNVTDLMSNVTDLMSNVTDVISNVTDLISNETDLMSNETDLMSNETLASADLSAVSNNTTTIAAADEVPSQTRLELFIDLIFGILFFGACLVSVGRLTKDRSHPGAETTTVVAFYTLIFLTSFFRSIYFLVPKTWIQPRYSPSAVMAFSTKYPDWFANYLSEFVKTLGSLCLYSIFILILVYWADILKKYFYPNARRPQPMKKFLSIVAVLLLIEVVSSLSFFLRWCSTEGMILINSVLLSVMSIVCMIQLLNYSNRFRSVLKTLGAINMVSTQDQDQRIQLITITGNVFFISRALLEVTVATSIFYHYLAFGNVDKVFSHKNWDIYTLLKYGFELAILCLMLYILKSQFNVKTLQAGVGRVGVGTPPRTAVSSTAKYERIPEKALHV